MTNSDTAPNVTRAISSLTAIPPGAVSLGAFAHPLRPEIAGRLVRFTTTGRYAIVSGCTLTMVPHSWAEAQAARLSS